MYKKNRNRRTQRKWMACLVLASLMAAALAGCRGGDSNNKTKAAIEEENSENGEAAQGVVLDVENMFTARDKEIGYDESESTKISLSEKEITALEDTVEIEDNTLTITQEGIYIISGTLADGQIIVDAQKTDKIQLVLNGASISSSSSAPVYIKQADKVFITLAQDTENTLTNTGEFQAIDDNNIDSVIFSKDDLTLNGSGTLAINTEYGHGIVSKDDLVITSGSYEITAAKHGMTGKDSVRIADGSFVITSGKDGIHSENTDDASLGYVYIANGTFHITAQTDGIDGAAAVQADGGQFDIHTGGGSENASKDSTGNDNPQWGQWGEKTKGRKPSALDGSAPEEPPSKEPDSGEPPKESMTPPSGVPAVNADMVQADTAGAGTANGDTAQTDADETQDTASAKAIKADGDIIINAGTFTVDSSDDSIHANGNVFIYDGTFTLSSGDDGIHADTTTWIQGGSISITKSCEGIEGKNIEISGGTISVVSSDDGINAAGGSDSSGTGGRPGQGSFNADADCFIKINGGITTITASGDGIDSNTDIYISGGETYITCVSGGGDSAIDYDGTAQITGGTVFAAGPGQMAQNFGDTSTQGAMLVSGESSTEGAVILKDSTGTQLASFTPQSSYNAVVISCPDIIEGETYTVAMGDTEQTIEMSSLIYGAGGTEGGRGGGFHNKESGRKQNKKSEEAAGDTDNTTE